MKNTLEGINSRITEAEEWISELEDRMVEITAKEQNKEKRMKRIEPRRNGQILREVQLSKTESGRIRKYKQTNHK